MDAYSVSLKGAALALFVVMGSGSGVLAQEMADAPLVITTDEGEFTYEVELALTPDQRSVGLMNRPEMDDDHGMLFRFDDVRPVSMWMKNTLIPLDMVFIRADGTVAGFHENARPLSLTTISSPEPVLYVLELNGGKAEEMGLDEGDTVAHPVIEKGRDE